MVNVQLKLPVDGSIWTPAVDTPIWAIPETVQNKSLANPTIRVQGGRRNDQNPCDRMPHFRVISVHFRCIDSFDRLAAPGPPDLTKSSTRGFKASGNISEPRSARIAKMEHESFGNNLPRYTSQNCRSGDRRTAEHWITFAREASWHQHLAK